MKPDKNTQRLIAVHRGWDAYEAGAPIESNPYKRLATRAAFAAGWQDAAAAQREADAVYNAGRDPLTPSV